MPTLVRMLLTFDLSSTGDEIAIPRGGGAPANMLDFPLCDQWLDLAAKIGSAPIEANGPTAADFHRAAIDRLAGVQGLTVVRLEDAEPANSIYNPKTKAWDPVPGSGRAAFMWKLTDGNSNDSMLIRRRDLNGGVTNLRVIPRIQVQSVEAIP